MVPSVLLTILLLPSPSLESLFYVVVHFIITKNNFEVFSNNRVVLERNTQHVSHILFVLLANCRICFICVFKKQPIGSD